MDIFSEIAVLQTQGCFNASDLVCLGMLAPQDIQGVSMAQMGLLISFWAFATLSDSLSFRLSEGYRQNSISKRKNTQTYLLELVVTPALLLYIIFTAPRIITLEQAGREGCRCHVRIRDNLSRRDEWLAGRTSCGDHPVGLRSLRNDL